jgi:DNA adenine methylase
VKTNNTANNKIDKKGIVPFLKWAGGKRWLLQKCPELFNIDFGKYIEPFVGSGAVFFHLMPIRAIIADKNKNLIDTYRAIKDDYIKVYNYLCGHDRNHSSEYYYRIRSQLYDDIYARAAQFIYLNRTCWNGLYRVNKNNIFNVPKGTKNKVIIETDDFEAISNLLKNAELVDGDFITPILRAEAGDLLFIDPPYTVKHDYNGFIKYNEVLFSWEDQIRLRDAVLEAKNRGAKVILTNANHDSVRELYEKNFRLRTLDRASVLSGKKEYRGAVQELLVTG